MILYASIVFVLFCFLLCSITDCGENEELRVKRKYVFKKNTYYFLFAVFFVFLWFLTAFRGNSVGNDTKNYLDFYKDVAHDGVNKDGAFEIGFQVFTWILSKITPNPYFLIFVSATFCYVLCGIYICKHSKNILFSTILFFCIAFSFFTSGIRQSLAMVIVLFAYAQLKKNKKTRSLILILLAASFHASSLVVLLWFLHKHIPKKPSNVLLITLIVFALSISGIIGGLLQTVLKEYQGYFEGQYAGTGWLAIGFYLLRALLFYYIIYNGFIAKEKEGSLAIANVVILLVIVCFGFVVNQFSRASSYFLLVAIVDMSNAFNSGKIKNRDILMLIVGGIMLVFFMITLIFRPEWNSIYPYEFNWSLLSKL